MNNQSSFTNSLVKRIEQLEIQRNQYRKSWTFFSIALLCFSVFFFYSFKENEKEIIRAKGIVITDESGRDRILIGAPFPVSNDRIRTNFEKSKRAWGDRFNGNFDWYKTNKSITNSGVGMLVLDENGHDRVAIGSPVPSSYIGRIAPVTGITVNDEKGLERGGYGLLRNEKFNRMVLGLDHITGYEGAIMSVLEDGSTNIVFNDPNNINRLHIMNDKGTLKKTYSYDDKYIGMIVKDSTGKIISSQ